MSLTKQTDASGLVYFGARYYDPRIGRFISRDPSGMTDGPNLYVYCKNDPVNAVDLRGMCKEKSLGEKIQLYLTLVGAEMQKGYMTNMQDIFGLIGVSSGAYINVGLIPKGIGYGNENFIQGGRTAYQWANQYGSGIKYYSFAKLGIRGSVLSIGSAIMLGWTIGDTVNAYYWGYLDYKKQGN
ncbi:MAG: RHS repeat-associated core domain-containing protein [Candidatus Omnitrophota bacterium]